MGALKGSYFIMDCTSIPRRRSQRITTAGALFEVCLTDCRRIREFAVEDDTVVSLDGTDYLVVTEADSLEELRLSVPYLFL